MKSSSSSAAAVFERATSVPLASLESGGGVLVCERELRAFTLLMRPRAKFVAVDVDEGKFDAELE